MQRFLKATALALAALLGLSSLARAAGPLDDRVPQDAIVYFGWAGADALQPQYANSNLKAIIEASAIREFISQQLPRLIDQAAAKDPQAPQVIASMQTGLAIAWKHPSAFYFCPVDFTNPQKPEFHFGLLCDAGSDAKTLTDLLNVAITSNPPPPELPVHAAQEGSLVSLTFGKPDTDQDRKRGGGLAATAAYIKAMAQVKHSSPATALYIDVAGALRVVNDGLAAEPAPPEVKQQVPQVLNALGLTSITQIALTSGFEGKEWADRAFEGVSGPRTGILTLFEGQPLSDGLLAAVPKEAAALTAFRFDFEKLFTETRTVIGKISPPAVAQFDAGLAQARQAIGLDVEKDIIAPLGDEWVVYRAPLSDDGGNTYALVQKLRDADHFARTLATAEDFANRMSQGRFRIEKTTESKIDVSSINFMQYSVAWTVRNGYLYVSSIGGIAGAVKQVENKSPSIAESDLFRKAMDALPRGVRPMSINYSNPAKLYPELRRALLGVLPFARAAGVDIPSNILPDAADIAPYLTPGATISWSDADGYHQAGRSAFPGAEVIGGSPGGPATVGVAALGTAILLPSLGKARELANRGVDASSERGIIMACNLDAQSNNDTFPDDLARLLVSGEISPKQLVSKSAGTAPFEMTPEMEQLAKTDFPKFAKAVSEHCDFVYPGAGSKSDADSNRVVLYQKPGANTREGMNVGYADTHVDWVRWAGMEEAFRSTNEMRRKAGLPAIDVRDLMRKSGAAPAPGPGLP